MFKFWFRDALDKLERDLGGLGIDSLWSRVINAIHLNKRSVHGISIKPSITGTWKKIVLINKELQALSIDLTKSIIGKVGNGASIKFWADLWMGDTTLVHLFPAIAKLATAKYCYISECMHVANGTITWDLHWKREPQSMKEIDQRDDCMALLGQFSVGDGDDKWEWSHNAEKTLTSASLRRMIEYKKFVFLDGSYGYNLWLPIKVNFLYWRTLLACLPTRVSLTKRGFLLLHNHAHCATLLMKM